MNARVLKGVLGLTASIGIAGITTLTVRSFSKATPQSIEKLLIKSRPDKRLLRKGYAGKTDGSQEEWKFVWKSYVNAHSGLANNPLAVELKNPDGNAPEEFRAACEKLFEEKVEGIDSEKYQLALQYCTRNAYVKDWIWEKGYQALSELNSEDGEWTNLWNAYKAESNIWSLSDHSNSNVTEEFKKRCGQEGSKAASGYQDTTVLNVLKYCSKKRDTSQS
ncbi:hypothetical protein MHC_01850 [Mycoplasma haemocanis str. Illinois]|uniref:Uncharacterized protein n=1 Tax=Mycoplasma haemocanis (strain Illinois) TaxID=1111676 RepID=H6N6G4_MYCHN|nr:hypothetical protein [Mycoplasma haemocanis]AEW45236.1 hypothetical protein MHC_01850 [Mycoplasma haemocanis str. Illinois]